MELLYVYFVICSQNEGEFKNALYVDEMIKFIHRAEPVSFFKL